MAFGSLGKLVVSIETDLTNFNKGLKDANNRVQKTRGEILKSTQQIGRAFTVMGAVVVGALTLVSKAAIDFEDSFAGVRKTVDLTEEGFAQLRQNLRDLSKEIPVSVNELSKIGEVVGQLGIKGVDNITRFTETISKLGLTTNIVGEVGALQLARFIGIIGESEKNVDRLGAVIVDLGNNFKTQEAELLDLSLNLASFGSSIKLRSDQVLAFATALKSSGAEAQAASSAFQKVALKLKDATITGGKDLKTFAKISRVTTKELVKIFEDDAAEALVIFLEGLRDIEEQGGSTAAALRELGLADVRLIREFGKIIPQTDVLREALQRAAIAFEDNTALTEEFEKKVKTTKSQLTLLFNIISDVAISLGDILLPRIKAVIDFMKPMIENIGKWVKENKKLADFLIIAAGAVGGFMLAVGPLLIALPLLLNGIVLVKAAIIALTPALIAVNTALIPIAAVAAAAFVGWQLGKLAREFFDLDEAMKPFFDNIIFFIDENGPKVERFFTKLGAKLENIRIKLFGVNEAAQLSEGFKDLLGLEEEGKEGEAEEGKTAKAKEEATKRGKIAEKESKKKGKIRTLDRTAFLKDLEGGLAGLAANLSAAEGLNKNFAKAAAAISIGLAIANTAQGVTKALADHPFPFSLIVAGIIAASGAIQIATIASQSFAVGTDNVPANLSNGEIVVPRSFSDAIRAGAITIGGPGAEGAKGGTILNVSNEITINGNVDEDVIDDMVEQIGQNLEEKLRRPVI